MKDKINIFELQFTKKELQELSQWGLLKKDFTIPIPKKNYTIDEYMSLLEKYSKDSDYPNMNK